MDQSRGDQGAQTQSAPLQENHIPRGSYTGIAFELPGGLAESPPGEARLRDHKPTGCSRGGKGGGDGA